MDAALYSQQQILAHFEDEQLYIMYIVYYTVYHVYYFILYSTVKVIWRVLVRLPDIAEIYTLIFKYTNSQYINTQYIYLI